MKVAPDFRVGDQFTIRPEHKMTLPTCTVGKVYTVLQAEDVYGNVMSGIRVHRERVYAVSFTDDYGQGMTEPVSLLQRVQLKTPRDGDSTHYLRLNESVADYCRRVTGS